MDPGPAYVDRGIKQRVSYFYDPDVGNYSYGYGHCMKPHRMRMAHNLISNYGLQRHMQVLRAPRATPEQMTKFHTDEYIHFLQQVTPETVDALTGGNQRFLTGEDCPGFEGLFEFCSISAGGSIAAAQTLNSGAADIAINWAGGLHHAKKREASGFCYVNDIVLAILELLRSHLRVLYIDIDIHHGDGVEEAFYSTDRVLTASFHKYGDFFPGTGDVRDAGIRKGKGYSVNVPLRDGITDESFGLIFREVIGYIMQWYQPGAVVLQCGADSLAGDKLGCFNLSIDGHADCVRFMRTFGVPLVVVGGGGYTVRNVARTWTYETGILLGQELDENLPFNDYMHYFGPEYKLDVPRTSMEDLNSREYLEGLRTKIIENLRSLPFAPSAQMVDVPRVPLTLNSSAAAELSGNEDSDLDRRISRRLRDAHIQRYGDELSGDEDEDEDPAREEGEEAAEEEHEEEADSDEAMADARPRVRATGSGMSRIGSQQTPMALANGHGGRAGAGFKLKHNGSAAAFGHDLASSYLVNRFSYGTCSDNEDDPAEQQRRLLDALGGHRSRGARTKRVKRTFFAARATAGMPLGGAAATGGGRGARAAAAAAAAVEDGVAAVKGFTTAAVQANAYYAAVAGSALNPRAVSFHATTPDARLVEGWMRRAGAGKENQVAALAHGHGQSHASSSNGKSNGAGKSPARRGGRRTHRASPAIWNGELFESEEEDVAAAAVGTGRLGNRSNEGYIKSDKTWQRMEMDMDSPANGDAGGRQRR
ncbi:hypothetical protein K437DRAFT_240226 [Tilletiaria anomala UBC 951]|uniref:histone deacetylase n=1 Tax=Tilletiaria anomala (strain ATCC 24038 / CBS 436.72 / UBC 951) TaxID=1037660 RepID=A0A066VD24_TILAU|nr:uncharacterized protein K437DRAFT_240226 [Tilletiaria anomala UBC 951]KDN38203.1 hypothetical protein K437DRAFT_240226 [Tilletiaria anomala UBC 951]